MSRNVELLAQLEASMGKEHPRLLPFTHRSAQQQKTGGDADSAFTEQMLRLVQRVFLSGDGSAPHQVVFCGVDGGNGSTSVCAGAARTLAATTSRSTCLVDANTRSPRLSRTFGHSDTSSLFQDRTSMREGCVQVESNLWIGGIVSVDEVGSLSHLDQLHVDQVKDRLTRLASAFDFVLIDVPGTRLSEDAAILGRLAGATILVIDANRTRRDKARRALETLEAASGVTVLGTVLYNRSFPIPDWVYRRL